jgi:hypothetical protein
MTKSKSPTTFELNKTLNDHIEKTDANMAAILEKLTGMDAKDRPAVMTKTTEAEVPNQTTLMTIGGTEDTPELITENLPDIDSQAFADKAKLEEFNHEPVVIRVHDTAEKQADRAFIVSVNGQKETFIRGQLKTVARYFVEALTRAKPVHYENQPFTDGDGARSVRYVAHRGLRYPFEVVEDRNPRGKAWLAECLAAPS